MSLSCVSPFKLLNQLADFYGTWCVGYNYGGHTKPLSLIPYKQQQQLGGQADL
jgi:hypothetical protein